MEKNNNITKDPVAAGRKGGRNKKGKRHFKSKLRQTNSWEDAEKLFEGIVVQSMTSTSPTVRRKAAKDFGDFIKPKKREQTGELNHNVKVVFENIKEDE